RCMTIYAVFDRDAKEVPAVVAERFSWLAFLLPPLFALRHGLLLALLGWLVAVLLLGAGPPRRQSPPARLAGPDRARRRRCGPCGGRGAGRSAMSETVAIIDYGSG